MPRRISVDESKGTYMDLIKRPNKMSFTRTYHKIQNTKLYLNITKIIENDREANERRRRQLKYGNILLPLIETMAWIP